MRVIIYPRGIVKRYFGFDQQKELEVPEHLTVAGLLKEIGFEWENCSGFGFVAVNGKRVCVNEPLKDGDIVKIYPRVFGG